MKFLVPRPGRHGERSQKLTQHIQMKMLTLEDRKELERMWSENAAPVKVAATLDISHFSPTAQSDSAPRPSPPGSATTAGGSLAPVKVAATLDISLCTVYAELKRGQAIDSEGEVVLDKNFRPAYSAERGQSTYNRNLLSVLQRQHFHFESPLFTVSMPVWVKK